MQHVIQNLHRAHEELLHDTTYWQYRSEVPRLLGCLSGDAMAQVLSFSRDAPSLAVSAVSKKSRLYAAVVGRDEGRALLPVVPFQDRLYFHLVSEFGMYDLTKVVELSAWWLARCELGVMTEGPEALQTMLDAPPEVRAKLRAVELGEEDTAPTLPPAVVQQLEGIDVHDKHNIFGSVVLSRMSNLRTVRIWECHTSTPQRIAQVRGLTSLLLQGPQITNINMRKFASAASLRSLEICEAMIREVTGIDECTSLVHLGVAGCELLDSLAPVAGTPLLRSIDVSSSTLESLEGLGTCPLLEHIEVQNCEHLESLAPLAGAPRLCTIKAQGSAITNLHGLNTCPMLDTIDVAECTRLDSLAPLAGAPALRHIWAQISGVRSVTGLNRCPRLEEFRVANCPHLRSLAPLAGAPRLLVLDALGSAVSCIKGLNKCPLLYSVDFRHCTKLKTLAPLAGAPELRYIEAESSGVNNIDGLSTCPLLESVLVDYCKGLKSLAPLAGTPSLHTISACNTGVRCIDGLHTCPALACVDLSGCAHLKSAASLEGAPGVEVRFTRTKVRNFFGGEPSDATESDDDDS